LTYGHVSIDYTNIHWRCVHQPSTIHHPLYILSFQIECRRLLVDFGFERWVLVVFKMVERVVVVVVVVVESYGCMYRVTKKHAEILGQMDVPAVFSTKQRWLHVDLID
jgi:hypothetical protein